MDLVKNPFYILGANTRDRRQEIMQKYEEHSLLVDSEECAAARTILTNPRRRLSAEVSWFPGLAPKRVDEVFHILKTCPNTMQVLDDLLPTSFCNLLATALLQQTRDFSEYMSEWTLILSRTFEEVDSEELLFAINEDRVVSGFPEIEDVSLVEKELQERRQYYGQALKSALDSMPTGDLVETVTKAVDLGTNGGLQHAPVLIYDLVDFYEVDAQTFLESELESIEKQIDEIKEATQDDEDNDPNLGFLVDSLVRSVKNWDRIAQPIQLATKSQGLNHQTSHQIASLVRGLGIELFNKHGKLEISQRLTAMLSELFAEVVEVAEQTEQDIATLKDLADERKRMVAKSLQEEEKWRKEITFEQTWGVMCFKSTVKISPEGVQWCDRQYPLERVTRIRWGGTRRIVNGMDRGTTYKVAFGDEKNLSFFTLGMDKVYVYSNFVSRLWRAIGTRMLVELFEKVGKGRSVSFGRTIVKDEGIVLERKKLFGKNELELVTWSSLSTKDYQGMLELSSIQDKRYCATFSYQEDDNTHVLSKAIELVKNQNLHRMSYLFQQRGE